MTDPDPALRGPALPPLSVIAIDGTAASGKGTLARRLAAHLGYACLDTGVLYRGVALMLSRAGIPFTAEEEAVRMAGLLRADNLGADLLDDPALRNAETGRGASVVAAYPAMRKVLLDLQRDFAAHPPALADGVAARGAILDGRDIGTVVCPDALVKFFIDADVAIRARRRHKELQGRGEDLPFETVLEDMKVRDRRDAGRTDAPMVAAADAVILDTTAMGPDEVFEFALDTVSRSTAL